MESYLEFQKLPHVNQHGPQDFSLKKSKMNQRRQTSLAKANAKQWPFALSLFNLLSSRSIHDVRVNLRAIAGFHCHTIIKTIKQIKSRMKGIKKDKYLNSLTKVQVCAMLLLTGFVVLASRFQYAAVDLAEAIFSVKYCFLAFLSSDVTWFLTFLYLV